MMLLNIIMKSKRKSLNLMKIKNKNSLLFRAKSIRIEEKRKKLLKISYGFLIAKVLKLVKHISQM